MTTVQEVPGSIPATMRYENVITQRYKGRCSYAVDDLKRRSHYEPLMRLSHSG